MVHAEKDKLRALYPGCSELMTPKSEKRVLPDIDCGFGKRLPGERIFD